MENRFKLCDCTMDHIPVLMLAASLLILIHISSIYIYAIHCDCSICMHLCACVLCVFWYLFLQMCPCIQTNIYRYELIKWNVLVTAFTSPLAKFHCVASLKRWWIDAAMTKSTFHNTHNGPTKEQERKEEKKLNEYTHTFYSVPYFYPIISASFSCLHYTWHTCEVHTHYNKHTHFSNIFFVVRFALSFLHWITPFWLILSVFFGTCTHTHMYTNSIRAEYKGLEQMACIFCVRAIITRTYFRDF